MRRSYLIRVVPLGVAVGAALLALSLWLAWSEASAQAAAGPTYTSYASGDFFFPPYGSDSDRMGLGGGTSLYNPALRAGWYLDWGAVSSPSHPDGMEYARTIYFHVNTNACGLFKIPASQRSQVTVNLTGTALIDNLRANPGALWMIGNEPDSIYNCSPIMPELYAELYHEFYTFIRAYDPSARVAIGAIVQPSPLRLEYLDKVLNHYQALYGEKLPTALWNIHFYVFPEVAGGAGAGVPPGASSSAGWYPNHWAQMVDLNVVAQNLYTMRQWMADRGERDKPLIITEFGQAIPDNGTYTLDGVTFTLEVSRDFLQGSITYFLTATDAGIGYPADGNRLVQFWAWYSLLDNFYGGDLVYADKTLTPAGEAFAQIASQGFTPYVDLYAAPSALTSIPGPGDLASASLDVQLDNHGNAAAAGVPVRFTQSDYASGQLLASNDITVSQVLTRYGGPQPQISAQWVLTPSALYTLTFEIDPAQTISQVRRSAQELAYMVGPDPAITSLTSDLPAVFLFTQPVTATFTATLQNLNYVTSAPGAVRFSLLSPEGTVYFSTEAPAPALAPNASADVMAAMTLSSPGQYVIDAALIQSAGSDLDAGNNAAGATVLAASDQVFLPLIQR